MTRRTYRATTPCTRILQHATPPTHTHTHKRDAHTLNSPESHTIDSNPYHMADRQLNRTPCSHSNQNILKRLNLAFPQSCNGQLVTKEYNTSRLTF